MSQDNPNGACDGVQPQPESVRLAAEVCDLADRFEDLLLVPAADWPASVTDAGAAEWVKRLDTAREIHEQIGDVIDGLEDELPHEQPEGSFPVGPAEWESLRRVGAFLDDEAEAQRGHMAAFWQQVASNVRRLHMLGPDAGDIPSPPRTAEESYRRLRFLIDLEAARVRVEDRALAERLQGIAAGVRRELIAD